jgi:hypothetical protein
MNPHTFRSATLTAILSITWTAVAGAQQQPGTNAPAPIPEPSLEVAAPAAAVPVLPEPVIDAKTQRSSLPNTPLLVTGLVVLGGTYGASVVAGEVSNRSSDHKLYYPVVGPWMALNNRDCNAQPCSNKTLGTALLVGSGVLQGVGALSVLLSFVVPRKTTRSWYLIGDEHQDQQLALTPVFGAAQLGAAATGTF